MIHIDGVAISPPSTRRDTDPTGGRRDDRSSGRSAEVKSAAKDGQRWLYARTVAKAAPKPAPTPEPKPSPVAAVPPPSPIHDDGTHAHQCDTCGDAFRTNTRLRQHQANAHKAS